MPDTAFIKGAGVHEHRGRAMGTALHIHVVGIDAAGTTAERELIESAVRRVEQLECRWSRFIPDSEISRCNSTRGIPVDVSADTRLLVRHAIRGWEQTAGAYDPTVLDSLIANGYDRSYDELNEPRVLNQPERPDGRSRPSGSGGQGQAHSAGLPAPGCTGIVVDDDQGTVTLPVQCGFDPGGIGKGFAADLVVEELISGGAKGAMVNIGGDLRAVGDAPTSDGWLVEINEPAVRMDTGGGTDALVATPSPAGPPLAASPLATPPLAAPPLAAPPLAAPPLAASPLATPPLATPPLATPPLATPATPALATLAMVDGGLATSTTRRRVWTVEGDRRHHVIDPRVGRPVESCAQLATVITGRAWWSEVVATQLLMSPPEMWDEVTGDAASLVVDSAGTVHLFGSIRDHLR